MSLQTAIDIRHDVFALALEGMQQSAIAGCIGLARATVNQHPLEACCYWNFGARQVRGGSSEDHTSSRLCFVQDGPTVSFCKCSGLGGADKEFI